MKRISILSLISVFLLSSFSPTHVDEFKIDSKKSKFTWTAKKVTATHFGNVTATKGKIRMDHGKLIGAEFFIDMNTITCTDIESEKYNKMLVDHLKNEDFFDVVNYPIANFKLIRATSTGEGSFNVIGELRIKKSVEVINFDMKLEERMGALSANGSFVFDRTKFDIIYGSGTFFDDLGDKAIEHEVKVDFNIVATK